MAVSRLARLEFTCKLKIFIMKTLWRASQSEKKVLYLYIKNYTRILVQFRWYRGIANVCMVNKNINEKKVLSRTKTTVRNAGKETQKINKFQSCHTFYGT